MPSTKAPSGALFQAPTQTSTDAPTRFPTDVTSDAEEVAVRDDGSARTNDDEEPPKKKNNKKEKKWINDGNYLPLEAPDAEEVTVDDNRSPAVEESPKKSSKKEKNNDGEDDADDTRGSATSEIRSAILGDETDDAQASIAEKIRTWWNANMKPSDGSGTLFTPLVIVIISAGGVFLLALVCCCLSCRKRRMRRRRSKVKRLESKKIGPEPELIIHQTPGENNIPIVNFTSFKKMYEMRRKKSKMSSAAPEEGNVQPATKPSNIIRIYDESDDEESAFGKDNTPVILIPVFVEEAGLLGIRLSSTCPFACVEEILPTANSACHNLRPGDELAPYHPASTNKRPTPYTLDEFTSLVALNERPLRFVAVRSSIDSAADTLNVVHMDMISDDITM